MQVFDSEALRELRVQCGYTQVEVANAIGVRSSVYHNGETGLRAPEKKEIQKIAKFFDVPEEILNKDVTPPELKGFEDLLVSLKKQVTCLHHLLAIMDRYFEKVTDIWHEMPKHREMLLKEAENIISAAKALGVYEAEEFPSSYTKEVFLDASER